MSNRASAAPPVTPVCADGAFDAVKNPCAGRQNPSAALKSRWERRRPRCEPHPTVWSSGRTGFTTRRKLWERQKRRWSALPALRTGQKTGRTSVPELQTAVADLRHPAAAVFTGGGELGRPARTPRCPPPTLGRAKPCPVRSLRHVSKKSVLFCSGCLDLFPGAAKIHLRWTAPGGRRLRAGTPLPAAPTETSYPFNLATESARILNSEGRTCP